MLSNETGDSLALLGVPRDGIRLLEIVPLVLVAWANDSVHPDERALVLECAEERGVSTGECGDCVAAWLDARPAEAWFHAALALLARLVAGSHAGLGPISDVLARAEEVAAASGGLLGALREDEAEQLALERVREAVRLGRAAVGPPSDADVLAVWRAVPVGQRGPALEALRRWTAR